MSRADRIKRHYEPLIHPHRANFSVHDWASFDSQQARFQVLADHVDLAGKTLLDVGCGLADLLTYLQRRGIEVRYTGVDLLQSMVRQARADHPDAEFIVGDPFSDTSFPDRTFEVVFCSGVFNLNLGNNCEFAPAAIRRLFELTRETLVFNMLHARAQTSSDPVYFAYQPEPIMEVLRPLPCEIELLHGYLANDFTIIARRTGSPDDGG